MPTAMYLCTRTDEFGNKLDTSVIDDKGTSECLLQVVWQIHIERYLLFEVVITYSIAPALKKICFNLFS